ncbi:unnamed protein product [Clonostachys chloroleuca]|uniref:Enoyl reductase (ER) domain-containing protein n=1 Tax=Clonostachys chloroleuca TaxID=1926264 RepID=A0AA35MGR3_9HYPO|nr:unnamed protein product [Clonostachys chloroleuca]
MSLPSTFKAALIANKGEEPYVSERSLAPLNSGEIAVKITATAINPVDWKIRDYGFFIKEWPTILGTDGAGEVVALGPDTSRFAIGDRVFFQGILGNKDFSTFQQYAKIPEALVAKTPKNTTDEEAAGISVTTVCGVVGFYDKTGQGLPAPWNEGGDKAGKGKAAVVLGGSSSVGQYAIQLARLSGFDRIITNSSPSHHEFLKKLGAHVVLDRSKSTVEDFAEAIGEVPLEFVFDAISELETQILGVKILQAKNVSNAQLITVTAVQEEAQKLGQSKEPKVLIKNVLGLGSSPDLRYLSEPLVKALGDEDGWLAKGLFIPNRPSVVPGGLAKLEEALNKVKGGVSGQKVIIKPQE